MLNNRKTRITTMAATGAAAAATLSMVTAGHASADTSVWDRVAQCESGGNWSINTGNGFYGGLQFTQSTWSAFGGSGSPQYASKAEQIRVAQNVLAGQGPGAWPVCSVRAGLTSSNGGASYSGSTSVQAAPQQQTSRSTTRQAAPVQQAPVQQAPVETKAQTVAPKKHKQHKHQNFQAAPKVQFTGATYTVKSGDWLSTIATKLGLDSWQSLYQANSSKISDPNLIFVGQVLQVPAK